MQERSLETLLYASQILRLIVHAGLGLLLIIIFAGKAKALNDSAINANIDFPHFGEGKKLVQDINFFSAGNQSGKLRFVCYRYTASGDSILVFGKRNIPLNIKAGVSTQQTKFGPNDANSFVLPAFYDILHKCGVIPAGPYKLYLGFAADSGAVIANTFLLQADSTLPASSSLNSQLDNILLQVGSGGGARRQAKAIVGSAVPASKALERSAGKINRMFRLRGLSPQVERRGGKEFVNLWYEDWFVGRYALEASPSAASQIQRQKTLVAGNLSSVANTELETYRSLFSQVRELTRTSKDDKELKGELAVSGNWSNGQPEYSAQDNNYHEVRGRVETEVADIPVSIEGFYTSQDAHRQVKGSYIRAHYDTDKAREKLMKLISGYRSQFSQTVAKGAGLEQVYGSYLSSLEGQKERLIADIQRGAGIPAVNGAGFNTEGLQQQIEASLAAKMRDTAALPNSAGSKPDSAGRLKRGEEKAAKIIDSAAHLYVRAMKRYEQVKKIEEQIQKYRMLLAQYRNTIHFDSALAYDKIKDLKSGDEATYKQMAKSAAGLLPEGKAKTFVAGLTSLDAGIFPKYVSKYTMGGQQLKGLDVGYDIGFAKVGLTVGSTEYAGRDGTPDRYTSYSGRVMFRPAKDQKVGLVYYGYTPSKGMLQGGDFFKNADISPPSFREPVHIVSAIYEGIIAKTVILDGEAATSFRKGSGQTLMNGFDADRLAWHLDAEGRIPETPMSLTGSYEHGGKRFQNSTLPMLISGADLYKAGVKGDFFHSFLTAGIQYNHLQQANFYSMGGNTRWGFDIATHSKQYPSLALSYKPFATFRSYSDTLSIPQRPLQGAVWTGKASYQIKKKGGISYRFSAVLNRSSSQSDTAYYGSNLFQLNAAYATKQWMIMLSEGQSSLATNSGDLPDSLNPAHVKTTFVTGAGNYSYSNALSLSAGADIGFAPFGLSKWGLNWGLSYRMKAPLTARLNGRYCAYRLAGYSGDIALDISGTDKSEPMSWRKLISGNVELIWRFRISIKG